MICETANVQNNGFANHGLGCNISVTFSDGSFEADTQITRGDISPKKTSFFESLMRRSPPIDKKEKESKPVQSSWTNIFSKKPATQSEEVKQQSKKDEEMARFIEQLEMEGKSEDEIKLHLSYIHEEPAPAPTPAPALSVSSPQIKSKNAVSQFFSDVHQAIKEISFDDAAYYPSEGHEDDLSGLDIGISSAPFFGALPSDTDMSYEELVSLEPVRVSRCVNNLPSCTHDGTPLPGDQTNCSVCLCEFNEGDTLKSLPCVHFFHKDCIDTWLMVGHSCPLCKTLVE